MIKLLLGVIITVGALWAQPCSLQNSTNCPCVVGQSPCQQLFLSQTNTQFNNIWGDIAQLPQNKVPIGCEIIPASGTWGNGDSPASIANGTATFYNNSHIHSWMDRLKLAGCAFFAINIDPAPYLTSTEYTGGSGLCVSTQPVNEGNILAILDSTMDYAKTLGIPVHLSTSPTNTTWSACTAYAGLSSPSTMTVAQMSAAIDPIYTAQLNHIHNRGDSVTVFTGGHEPTGYWSTVTGQTFSPANWSTFVTNYCAAIPVFTPAITCAVGFTSPDNSYVTYVIAHNSTSVLVCFDVYGSATATQYESIIFSGANSIYNQCLQIQVGGFKCAVNESAPPRQVDGSCVGTAQESCSYYGCNWVGWDSWGFNTSWIALFNQAMEAAGAIYVNIFSTQILIGTINEGNTATTPGTNCADTNPLTSATALVIPTPAAILTSVPLLNNMSAGATIAIEGNLKITGHLKGQ